MVCRPSKELEEKSATTCDCGKRKKIESWENLKQEKGMRKRQVLSTVEGNT